MPDTDHAVLKALEQWEAHVLTKMTPQNADHDYAQVQQALMEIGGRIARRMSAANANKCSHCHKPLPPRGPADTIPRPAPELMGGWVNDYACSARCADALRQKQHDREMKRLAAANG